MKKLLVLMSVVFCANLAWAQDAEKYGGRIDFRIGGLFSSDPEGINHFSVGFKAGGNLGKSLVANRFSWNFAFDYSPIFRGDYYHPELGQIRFAEYGFLFSPSLGFDVVRTKRFNAGVHGGLAAVGRRQTVSLMTMDYYGYTYWENICRYDIFPGACSFDWKILGSYGAEMRYFITEIFYFGADIERYADKQNHFVGMVGVVF